jgi:hypothetical protein
MLACTDQFTQKTAEAKTKNPLEQNSSRRGFIFPEKWIFGAKGQRASSSFIATMPKSHRPTGALYNLGERKCSSKGASDQIIDQQPTAAVIFNVTSFSP